MAEMEKYTDEAVEMLLKHAKRQLKNDHNRDIIEKKSDMNYSIGMYPDADPKVTYKEIVAGSYLYGRGTKRELEANTCCSWVITLPKSVSDYSTIGKDEVKQINPVEERLFFEGVCKFVSDRYGSMFFNRVHYDEGGQPHIHIYFVPRTKLDHDLVQHKTTKSHHFVRLESGRYEYQTTLQLDKNGEKIPVKNFSRDTDYYDSKISCADVMNKAEMQHFHGDLASYMKQNGIPGADSIYTGATGGTNLTVKTMKEFKEKTGLQIEELKEKPLSREALKEALSDTKISKQQRLVIENINSEALLKVAERTIQNTKEETKSLKEKAVKESVSSGEKISSLEAENKRLQSELAAKETRIKELEEALEKSRESQTGTATQGWGEQTQTTGWGNTSGWGNKEEIKSW